MKKRTSSDRRTSERRIQNIEVEFEQRDSQRRSGYDRRAIMASQSS